MCNSDRERDEIQQVRPVTKIPVPGRRGRPRKHFYTTILAGVISGRHRISAARLARAMKVRPNTLRKHLKQAGYQRFSDLNNFELDTLMREFRRRHPKSGIRYAVGFFGRHRLRVTKQRIAGSLRRINPISQRIRGRTDLQRRMYKTTRPNSMWHIDGHHKPTQWGFVFHGFIGGYTRKVRADTFMCLANPC